VEGKLFKSKDLNTNVSKMVHMVQKRDNIELEIILILLNEDLHLRAIAKKLSESHSTISRRLNELLKDNIIDYKIEGKNKTFFIKKNLKAKNYIFNAERYKFIKLLNQYPELNIIIEDILNKSKNMVILFGSYAKFKANKNSDIDIYVETKDKNIKKDLESLNSKINVKIGTFDPTDNLIKEIVKNHIILKDLEGFYEKIFLE
jgi:predicted nucleotidyltransferase